MPRPQISVACAVVSLALLVSSCAQGPTVSSAPTPAPTEATTVATPSPPIDTTSAEPTASASPTPTSTPTDDDSPDPSPGVTVVGPGSATTRLTLAQAVSSEGWDERSYTPVGSDPMQAMGAVIGCYDEREVEFRFNQRRGTFRAEVAQDQNSQSSDQTVEFALIVDGSQLDTRRIGFKESQFLGTDLAGVAVVKVRASLADDRCSGKSVTALITSVTIDS